MGFESIANSINAYLQDVADTNGYTIRYDNDPRATPSSGLWLKISIVFDDSKQKEIGINSFRNVGSLNIEICNSIKLGVSHILHVVDKIVKQFIELTINNSIKFKTPRIGNIGRVQDNYQINVICPFFIDN